MIDTHFSPKTICRTAFSTIFCLLIATGFASAQTTRTTPKATPTPRTASKSKPTATPAISPSPSASPSPVATPTPAASPALPPAPTPATSPSPAAKTDNAVDPNVAPRKKGRFELGAEAARGGRVYVTEPKTAQSGCALVGQGKYEEAISILTEVIAGEPENVNAYGCRGQAYAFINRMVDALRDADKVFALAPETSGGILLRGNIYAQQEKYLEAIEEFTKVIAKGGVNQVVGYANRGYSRLKIGKWQEALADYNQVIVLDPKAVDAYEQRALIHNDHTKDYDAAVSSATAAFRLDPQAGNALLFRAYAFKNLGNWKAAEEDYTKAFALQYGSANSYVNRGEVYEKLGRLDEAIADYRKALSLEAGHANAKKNLDAALARKTN